jgi:redox-sensitive bicupin YhaK (pirin superfamily)
MLHRDSTGVEAQIRPGEVNLMVAGKGVAHSERSVRSKDSHREGIQLWIALPKDSEEVDPSFHHADSKDIPLVKSKRLVHVLCLISI